MKTQKTLNSQNNLEKEEWSERNHCPDFTRSCKTTVMETVLAQKHARLSARQDGEHGSKPCTHGHLIRDRGGRNIQWGKYSFSLSGDGKMGQVHVEE